MITPQRADSPTLPALSSRPAPPLMLVLFAAALSFAACNSGETHWQGDTEDTMTTSDTTTGSDTSTGNDTTVAGDTGGSDTSIGDAVFDTGNVSDAASDSMAADTTPSDTITPNDVQDATDTTDTTDTADMVDPGPTIAADDQVLSTIDEVVIASVTIDQPGWVVVHDADDNVLGHVAVGDTAGLTSHTDVVVELSRDLTDGEMLRAVLAADLGAMDTFEYPDPDLPITDDAGNPVEDTFTVTLPTADASAMDQTVELRTQLAVDVAQTPGRGWLAVLDDKNGQPDDKSVRGLMASPGILADGTTPVLVTILPPLQDQEVLHVRVYSDDGDGLFEPGKDDFELRQPDDGTIGNAVTVTVPAGTPHARLTLDAVDAATGEMLWSAQPADLDLIVEQTDANSTLDLVVDWRFEVVNPHTTDHPLDLTTFGWGAVLLSQDSDGLLESEATIDWVENADGFVFTLTATLAAELGGYQCATHPMGERGEISSLNNPGQ